MLKLAFANPVEKNVKIETQQRNKRYKEEANENQNSTYNKLNQKLHDGFNDSMDTAEERIHELEERPTATIQCEQHCAKTVKTDERGSGRQL